jgi:hypothetical protein
MMYLCSKVEAWEPRPPFPAAAISIQQEGW